MPSEYPYKYQDKNVRFIYLRDSENAKAIATVAYVGFEGKLLYAWALNRSTKIDEWYRNDEFSKKMARTISLGRIQHARSRREIDITNITDDVTFTKKVLVDITTRPSDGFAGTPRGAFSTELNAPDRLVRLAGEALADLAAREAKLEHEAASVLAAAKPGHAE